MKVDLEAVITSVREHDHIITEFYEELWISLVDYMQVTGKDDIRFILKDDQDIKVV